MPLSKREQDAIMIADLHRRHERQLLEDAALGIDVDNAMSDRYKIAHAPKDSHVNACLVRSIGVVCTSETRFTPRFVKARAGTKTWADVTRRDHFKNPKDLTDMGTFGVAPGSTDPTPSVLVIKDGIRTVVPASNFGRATRSRGAKTPTVQQTPETARLNHHHNFND